MIAPSGDTLQPRASETDPLHPLRADIGPRAAAAPRLAAYASLHASRCCRHDRVRVNAITAEVAEIELKSEGVVTAERQSRRVTFIER